MAGRRQTKHIGSEGKQIDAYLGAANQVLNCSLAKREELETLGQSFTITPNLAGSPERPWRIAVDRPHEEEIEAAAARLRKIMVAQEEDVYLGKILKIIGRYTDVEARENWVSPILQMWDGFTDMHYFSAGGIPISEGEGATFPLLKDRQIAIDWLYGELLHYDVERRERIKHVGEETKFQAGLLWAKDSIILVWSVKNLIVALQDSSRLKVPR
ncbi:hypothetical protein ACFRFQ_17765 [Rhodococcus sp. NPDC056743]|uniref:hypothetical protein n=1 Tax=Rhodococcus sp. NPDC056743 TaxID=3345934 RepID=UPI00366E2611